MQFVQLKHNDPMPLPSGDVVSFSPSRAPVYVPDTGTYRNALAYMAKRGIKPEIINGSAEYARRVAQR